MVHPDECAHRFVGLGDGTEACWRCNMVREIASGKRLVRITIPVNRRKKTGPFEESEMLRRYAENPPNPDFLGKYKVDGGKPW